MSIDLVVNCYERTYRDVLRPGFMSNVVKSQCRDFDCVTVLINNVDDPPAAAALASAVKDEVDRYAFVHDLLPGALEKCGLSRRHLRRLTHFTDCCLVAVTMPGPAWVVYWDAGAVLREPGDWITPTVDLMTRNPQIAVGNPNNWHIGLAERESLYVQGDFAIGYGFSDVAFVGRRKDFSRHIYRRLAPASWRYPLAHIEPVFEQRIDAWMRCTGRQRATYLPLVVDHPEAAGANYPAASPVDRLKRRAQQTIGRSMAVFDHPATRPWPR